MEAKEAGLVMVAAQIELYFYLTIEAVIIILWVCTGHIEGFSPIVLLPSPSTGVYAVSHAGFWLALTFLSFAIGVFSIGFTVWVGKNREMGLWVQKTRSWIIVWVSFVSLDMIAMLIHFVLTRVEVDNLNSTISVNPQNYGFLTALQIGLWVMFALEGIIVYRAIYYYVTLEQVRLLYAKDIKSFEMEMGGTATLDQVEKLYTSWRSKLTSTTPAPAAPEVHVPIVVNPNTVAPTASKIGHGLKVKIRV